MKAKFKTQKEKSIYGVHHLLTEELVAEMGAAFLCGITHIEQQTIQNNAAYIKSWIRTFKDDPKILVMAAAQAQNAVNYILNQKLEPAPVAEMVN